VPGSVEMVEEALSELSGMPVGRVSALVHDKGGAGFRALFNKAGLPASTYPAFREAVNALGEGGFDPGGTVRLRRRMVERVLTRCADEPGVDLEPLLTLLRRFAAEAAREEARPAATTSCNTSSSARLEPAATPDHCSSGMTGGARMLSRYSGRSRFSRTKKSSVTSRSRLASVSATIATSGRAFSRTIARTLSTCCSTRLTGMRLISGV